MDIPSTTAPPVLLPTAAFAEVDIADLITEDDTPVDNLPSAKQQRLLVESLYSSWQGPGEGGPFLAMPT